MKGFEQRGMRAGRQRNKMWRAGKELGKRKLTGRRKGLTFFAALERNKTATVQFSILQCIVA